MVIKTILVKLFFPLVFLGIAVSSLGFLATEVVRSLTVVISVPDFAVDRSPQATARGAALYQTRRCAFCHGDDLGGATFFHDRWMGTVTGPNLTTGEGGVAGKYKFAQDWSRAIRYGLNADSHPLMFMPSDEYATMTNKDISALIAFLMSAPPVNRTNLRLNPGAWPRAMYTLGQFSQFYSYQSIAEGGAHVEDIPQEANVEYGKYLAADCASCHGTNLQGQHVPGMPPKWPRAGDITSKGMLARYTNESFRNLLRTGQTSGGRILDPKVMPWSGMKYLRDPEIDALFIFLKSR